MRISTSKRTLGVITSMVIGFTAATTTFAMNSGDIVLAPSGQVRPDGFRMPIIDRLPKAAMAPASNEAFPSNADLLSHAYAWDERTEAVLALQFVLNISTDGHYGKITRTAHLERLRSLGMPTDNVPILPVSAMTYGNKQCPQWEDLALAVGWPEAEIETLSYVIFRESTCRPTAHNTSDPTWAGSRGLMQVNGYWCIPNKYNPDGWLQQQGVLSHCDDLFDPETNLRAGLLIWKRSGWGPWSL